MRWYISSVADVRTWTENTLDVDGEQAGRVARAVWSRPDFPHPAHHADLTDYLGRLDDDWLYDQADNVSMISGTPRLRRRDMPFAVIRECGVSGDSRGWAEMDGPAPVAHATRAGAERAAAALVPAGKDPWAHAGLKVRRVRPDNGLMVLDN